MERLYQSVPVSSKKPSLRLRPTFFWAFGQCRRFLCKDLHALSTSTLGLAGIRPPEQSTNLTSCWALDKNRVRRVPLGKTTRPWRELSSRLAKLWSLVWNAKNWIDDHDNQILSLFLIIGSLQGGKSWIIFDHLGIASKWQLARNIRHLFLAKDWLDLGSVGVQASRKALHWPSWSRLFSWFWCCHAISRTGSPVTGLPMKTIRASIPAFWRTRPALGL